MIKVTRLNNAELIINAEKIQSLHAAPDTVITFTNNDKIMVRERVEELSSRIVEYQRLLRSSPLIEAGLMHDYAYTIN